MINIRKGLFETNSSSVHTLVMCSKEEYQDFINGKMLLDLDSNELIHPEQADDSYWTWSYTEYLDKAAYFDKFKDEYTTKQGETVVAFGYSGYDG